jgi:hypothetical protein
MHRNLYFILTSVLCCTVICFAAGSVYPQDVDEMAVDVYAADVPRVAINDKSVSLQNSLFPDYYRTRSARLDMRWARQNDSALTAFWNESGAVILSLLAEYSGLEWIEQEFDIYFVRYYRTIGEGVPTIMPIGGVKRGQLTEAVPSGALQQLNLIYQLSHRMLAQPSQPRGASWMPVASHPLMQPSPYRRDNLAWLLTLVVAQHVIGLDSTFDAYQSQFWSRRHAGREVFEKYMLKDWILTPEQPLSDWVIREPYGSDLVSGTRPPRRSRLPEHGSTGQDVEGLPVKGQLGIAVTTDDRGRLVVNKIDIMRLAYACGLQEGDIIRQVDGARARNHKSLVERILRGLDSGGATLSVLRGGQPVTVVIQPVETAPEGEDYLWDYEDDSLYLPPGMIEPTDSL